MFVWELLSTISAASGLGMRLEMIPCHPSMTNQLTLVLLQYDSIGWSHTPFIEHIHTHKHSHAACAYIAVHEHIHSHVFEFVTTITLSKPPKACVWSYEPGAVSWRFFCGMPSSCQLTSPIQHVFGFISCMNVQEENVQKVKLWVYTPYCRA